KFSIGVDIMKVIAETPKDGCIKHDVMATIDRFGWRMENTLGVQSTISLAKVAKIVYSSFNETNPKWHILPRSEGNMVASVQPLAPSTGLLNTDCSAMPIFVFTSDHKATTIDRIVKATNKFNDEMGANSPAKFRLASGNVGVMAAANEVIHETDRTVLFWV